MIFGTLCVIAPRPLIAVPLSLGRGDLLTEFAPKWLAAAVAFLVELCGHPERVYGPVGISVLIPFLRTVVVPHSGPRSLDAVPERRVLRELAARKGR